METTDRKRETNGQYAYEGGWDRLCVCGHTLGVHGAGSPAQCLLYSLSDVDLQPDSEIMRVQRETNVDCGCGCFRLSRKKA